jgi:hypothetical protein
MYDYLLGGTDNFEVDREVVERASAPFGGLEVFRENVRANRAFIDRAVCHLVADAGIRQFLDIGTGVPVGDATHAVAQRVAPECRVVYVDKDPIVLAHAHTLERSTPEGAAAFVDGDLREPDEVLRAAALTLDLDRPVAIVLAAVLHLLPDGDDPYGIVRRLLDATATGSHLVVTHLASDVNDMDASEQDEAVRRLNERTLETYVLRTRDEVRRFFDGLEMVGPGVVGVDRWPVDGVDPVPAAGRRVPFHCGVGRTVTGPRRRVRTEPAGSEAAGAASDPDSTSTSTSTADPTTAPGPVFTGPSGSTRWVTGHGRLSPGRRPTR